jgi:hypothetical protein
MINGAHMIVYSQNAEADQAFFRDVLSLPGVDAGEGYLIYGLPPAEIAVHADEGGGRHELYLMCENLDAVIAELFTRGVTCSPPSDQGWGILSEITLPGGGKLGVYQPRHARPPQPGAPAAGKTSSKGAAKRPAARKAAAKKPAARKPAAKKRAVKPAGKKKTKR